MPTTEGSLLPGTFITHPLQAADKPLSVTFTVAEGWEALREDIVLLDDVGFQLLDITSLNADPCHWSGTADDVDAGTTVDELVDALVTQDDYDVSEPVDATIGGYSGKRVEITHPADAFAGPDADGGYNSPGCDESQYRIWSTVIGDNPFFPQAPDNRWQATILDVDGTRLVVVAMDFPNSAAEDRAQLDAVIDSFVIEP